jgi:RND family efflux transporter MFP subunit
VGLWPSQKKISPGTADVTTIKTPEEKIRIDEQDVPVIYSTVGTIGSRNEIEISSRIMAKITNITCREGDSIKKGDILVSLDESDLKAALAKAKERLKEAQANLELQDKEFARSKILFEKNTIPKKSLDQAESAHQTASAILAASKEQIKEAEAALSYASIASPIDGIISKRYLDPGDLALPGTKIVELFDNSRLMFYVPISESLILKVKLGDKMQLKVDAVGKTYEGEVKEISRAIDPDTRTFLVKICLGHVPDLLPGMFGTLHLQIGTEKVMLIPKKVIQRNGQLEYVMKLNDDGTVSRELIRTTESNIPNKLNVISGLQRGDTIVIPMRNSQQH